MDGALVVDKPEGPTSHDVVAAIRRLVPRGTKVGHTGTLDPLATGVLPVLVGRATRLAQFLTASSKRYTARIAFGYSTTTYDRAGEPVRRSSAADLARLTPSQVAAALEQFHGHVAQVPPAFSAKRRDGRRSYDRARAGDLSTPDSVDVDVSRLEILSMDRRAGIVELDIVCSAGFYVRSLAHDLGEAVGVPAHLAALRRTASGTYGERDATPWQALLDGTTTVTDVLLPMQSLLADWPSVDVTTAQTRDVGLGRPVVADDRAAQEVVSALTPGARVRLLAPDGSLVALARVETGHPRTLHADIVLAPHVDAPTRPR